MQYVHGSMQYGLFTWCGAICGDTHDLKVDWAVASSSLRVLDDTSTLLLAALPNCEACASVKPLCIAPLGVRMVVADFGRCFWMEFFLGQTHTSITQLLSQLLLAIA